MRITALLLLLASCGQEAPLGEPVATFSIVARDPVTGDLGVAVQSKTLAVGSIVPWARADVGVVATQAWANVQYGPDGLKMLADGRTSQEVVEALTRADGHRERRQLAVVDAKGRVAVFTGSQCLEWAGHKVGKGYCAQGNLLAGRDVVAAMARSFEESKELVLAERLVKALAAGQAAGGDKRGRQSASLHVVRKRGGYGGANDRFIDLRVDDHPQPIGELARLLSLHGSKRKK